MKPLTAPGSKPIILKPVRASAAIEAKYRARLKAMIEEMQASLLYWIKAQWNQNPPAILAADAAKPNAGKSLVKRMGELGDRWQRNFDRAAPKLAEYFATAMVDRSDEALRKILRDGGFSVKFQMTPAANDMLNATIGEQVGLIKSIAAEHLQSVEGIILRSVSAGGDLAPAVAEIEARYGVTYRRASLIARDQNQKATANITKIRQVELGITEAIWVHSGGGREPRPTHLKAGKDKVRFDVQEGWLDPAINQRIWPGQLINCRCVSKAVVPGFS